MSARSSRANAETRRHDALEAEKHLDLALKTQPNDTEALFYRAINSSYLGNVPSALDDYNRVIGHLRTKSDDRVTSELLARSYFGAAQLWWEVNRKGKARDRARDAIDALPASLSESEEAGEMHKFLGEVREVLRPGPLAIRSTSTAIRILEPITSERARRLTMEAKQTLERLRLVQANTSITQIDEGAEESDSTDDDLNPPHQSAHPPQ